MKQESKMESKAEEVPTRHKQEAPLSVSEHSMSARKAAVIVGASSGIGRETALRLLARGFRVYNISRTQFKGNRVKTIVADAAIEGEIERAVKEAGEESGSIDLLIYSAGFSMAAPIEHAKSRDYRYLFEVNYFGAVEAIRAAAPFLKRRGGRAILLGSLGGDMPIPYDCFYSSSKAALEMLAREADLELRPHGVRVSAILPGGTSTNFTYSRRVYGEEESLSYAPSVKRASAALANMEQGGMNPSIVADAVIKLAEKKNPPTVSAVGGKNNFARYAMKVLPERVTDWFVRKKFNQR
ncbi:MAG: SDR family NAD(P)-dependent oxidoreductase [Clostridia bacterium]|nr:SDR family NAD(P)-dependent oxidoreductase [Clostridia bacterium]